MKQFTVIAFYEESGQSVCEHVEANNGIHAFWVLAQENPDLTMVVAVPGHLTEGCGDLVFPGEGVVDASTVLEQPDVFGPAEVESDAEPVEVEVLPGASRQEITEVMMQDIVGDYDVPAEVPEWAWVERVASFAHVKNGESGVFEFVLNLGNHWDDIPEKLLPVIQEARAQNKAYLIVHQGT